MYKSKFSQAAGNLYNEKNKTLMKERVVPNKWKDIQCS